MPNDNNQAASSGLPEVPFNDQLLIDCAHTCALISICMSQVGLKDDNIFTFKMLICILIVAQDTEAGTLHIAKMIIAWS